VGGIPFILREYSVSLLLGSVESRGLGEKEGGLSVERGNRKICVDGEPCAFRIGLNEGEYGG